jgi:hypothetical protein
MTKFLNTLRAVFALLLPLAMFEYYDWRWSGDDRSGLVAFMCIIWSIVACAILVAPVLRDEFKQ